MALFDGPAASGMAIPWPTFACLKMTVAYILHSSLRGSQVNKTGAEQGRCHPTRGRRTPLSGRSSARTPLLLFLCVGCASGARWGNVRAPEVTSPQDSDVTAAFNAVCGMLLTLQSQMQFVEGVLDWWSSYPCASGAGRFDIWGGWWPLEQQAGNQPYPCAQTEVSRIMLTLPLPR